MSQPFTLYRLQQIDSQLDQVHSRLKEIEMALANNLALQKANEQYEEATALYEVARKDLRRAEEAVASQRIKIDQTESTLYGGKVRNPKELQDLQNETFALRRYLIVLEDRQLEAMITFEQVELDQKTAREFLEKTQLKIGNQNKILFSEQNDLLQEQQRLQSELEAAASAIEESDLLLYQRLRKTRRGVAVARVVDNTCAACGSTLSTAQLHAAKSLNQIIHCDSCGRILYGGVK